MTDAPTLADMMIHEWSRSQYRGYDPNHWVARTIAQARKFVLDKSMSEYLADLGNSWLPGIQRNPRRLDQMLNGYRILARLPHSMTWIEYDFHAMIRRCHSQWAHVTEYEETFDPTRSSSHAGWLLLQHPKVDTAFMALGALSHSSRTLTSPLLSRPIIDCIGAVWTVDDCLPPYQVMLEQYPPTELLPGGFVDRPQINIAVAPWVATKQARSLITEESRDKAIEDFASNQRFLWTLLAAINDTPVTVRQVRPTKGHMVRGNYKRFSEHSVISLNIPKRVTMAQLAKRVLRATRRRAHMVRGHWRRDWRFPLSPLCEHRFEPVPDTHLNRCTRCLGRKMWITEHQSGDASLGFVLHDYEVHHKAG